MRTNERTRLRGSIGLPVRLVNTKPVSAQADPSFIRSACCCFLRAASALAEALRRYGIPDQILTGNGKVFTARFGQAR
jgi:hypothetical protein